jgi:Trypsin-like peptidase domain
MQKWMFMFFLLAMATGGLVMGQTQSAESFPIATQWLLDAAGPSAAAEITSVFKIVCPKTQMLGTGFALDTGYIITNSHVVGSCGAADLVILSSSGATISVSSLFLDTDRDLAVMKGTYAPRDVSGLRIHQALALKIGAYFTTWGYPFGHAGPAPLWNFGHLSGFNWIPPATPKAIGVKHLVILGAFNPGNSGGPLLADGAVAGVVVSKRLFSLPPFLASAIEVMAKNGTGVAFEATDGTGKKTTFIESQLTAELLKYYRDVSQVFIGEAIAAEELIAFLDSHQIPWHHVEQAAAKKTNTPTKK